MVNEKARSYIVALSIQNQNIIPHLPQAGGAKMPANEVASVCTLLGGGAHGGRSVVAIESLQQLFYLNSVNIGKYSQ